MNLQNILQSLSLRTKLTLLLAPALLGVLVTGGLLVSQFVDETRTAQQELDGLPPLRQLQTVIRLTQQHRGLSGAWLAGNAAAGDKRQAREAEVIAAMKDFEQMVRSGEVDGMSPPDWQPHQRNWDELLQAVKSRQLKSGEAIARHTALIQSELQVMDQLLFDTQLILDPTAEGYSLVTLVGQQLPVQAERLGQLRGRGTAALSAGHLKPEDAALMLSLVAQAQSANVGVVNAMKHALQGNPALKGSLQPLADTASSEMQRITQLIRKELLDSEDLHLDPNQFYADATQAIDAQFKFLGAATDALGQALEARAKALRHRTLGVAIGLALLFVLSLVMATAIASALLRGFRHAVRVAEALARGELDTPIDVAGSDEVAHMLGAMATTQTALRDIVLDVRQGVESVSAASAQIAQGNADLESRTQQQAASVARTSSTMHQMTSSVQSNAANAVNANGLAGQTSAVAQRSGEVVHQVVDTMEQIRASSTRIADITSVIDGIAFQTNILALNAAVEAARAGEQGRGFAVVAGEVRSLAQRSATAAQEIKQLIGESVERVSVGNAAVREAGRTIEDMVAQVREVATLIAQISSASHEQSGGIAEVGQALAVLDNATQQNATLVEEGAAAARSLQDQASRLLERVAVFRLSAA